MSKKKRSGGALVGFAAYGMPRNNDEANKYNRTTKAEAVAAVDAMQAARDADGARVFKPKKPPRHDFGPPRSRAAERDAGKHNGKTHGPEFYGEPPEVATDYFVAPRVARRL